MNGKSRLLLGLAAISGAYLCSAVGSLAASKKELSDAAAQARAEQREAEAARAKDPAWKPSHHEVRLIQVGDAKKPGLLKNFCLNAEGNLLACYAPTGGVAGTKNAAGIRIYSPEGELLKTLPLALSPSAISVAKDGSIFVAGEGRLLKLDPAGKVLASAASPAANLPVTIGADLEEMIKEMTKSSRRSYEDEVKRMKTSLEARRAEVTGLAVTGEDVFMAVPAPNDFSYRVYRLDHTLANPKLVVEKLRGCCGQMDIQAHDGQLWIAHNARHGVEARDRDGKELTKFGRKGKVKASDFGGCCEPKCMRVLADGEILAAESGPPTCIKRFSAAGKFLGVVAVLETKGDCVRVTVERSPDGNLYYLLDTTRDAIRVFKAKG